MFEDVPTFTGAIHPYADAFPMLPDADLDALAADIKANGLAHPLVLTPDGALLDGRNRLAACERAGIEPRFVVHAGDPIAYVISSNMQRRDLTQAQKAHLTVASDLDSKSEGKALAAVSGVPASVIAQARVVARFTPEASRAVIEGRKTHADAYTEAKTAKELDEQTRKQRATLADEAPDLLPLDHAEGWAAYQVRTKDRREKAEATERNRLEESIALARAVYFLAARTRGDYVQQTLDNYQAMDLPPSTRIDAAAIDHAIDTLTYMRKARFHD
jgi:ParB-like chromosome segregation protein Spo0J